MNEFSRLYFGNWIGQRPFNSIVDAFPSSHLNSGTLAKQTIRFIEFLVSKNGLTIEMLSWRFNTSSNNKIDKLSWSRWSCDGALNQLENCRHSKKRFHSHTRFHLFSLFIGSLLTSCLDFSCSHFNSVTRNLRQKRQTYSLFIKMAQIAQKIGCKIAETWNKIMQLNQI